MSCACIGIYRKERLDESYRENLRMCQQFVKEDATWFSIELEWDMKPSYTDYERQQLTDVFGSFPEQEILIFGDCNRIFVAAYEIIKHFGGLLAVPLATNRRKMKSYPGIKIEVHKKKYKNPLKYAPDYYLVDHIFIRKYFAKGIEQNFKRFRLDHFLPSAYLF